MPGLLAERIDRDEFVRMYRSHVSNKEIGRHFGIAHTSVATLGRRWKLGPRPPESSCRMSVKLDTKKFAEWYEDTRYTNSQIATEFGVCYTSVRRLGMQLGLPPRPRGLRGRNDGFPTLTDEEIRERCLQIQAGWDEETEYSRRVTKGMGAITPMLSRTTVANGQSRYVTSECDLKHIAVTEIFRKAVCRNTRPDGAAANTRAAKRSA